jgi:hypothetical protein
LKIGSLSLPDLVFGNGRITSFLFTPAPVENFINQKPPKSILEAYY